MKYSGRKNRRVLTLKHGIRDGFLIHTFGKISVRHVFILHHHDVPAFCDTVTLQYRHRYHFFQYYFPEVKSVYANRKYGYNIKSQLLKLFIIFPGASALVAWLCSYLVK